MFFNISPDLDSQFPNNHNHGFAFFNCDNGWEKYTTNHDIVYAKGYADDVPLAGLIDQFEHAGEHTGNFCLIKFGDCIEIQHNKTRSFPLRYNLQQVTNLYPGENIWADSKVTIHQPWQISVEHCLLDLSMPDQVLTIDQAENAIFDLLNKRIQNFFAHSSANLQLFVSGGIDTLLLYALLSANKCPFTLLPVEEHYDADMFTTNNQMHLDLFWAYKQIHHWKEPTWLATGSCGDEYLLRGPATIAMLTAWHDIDFAEIIQSNPETYHYRHFMKYLDLWKDTWNNRAQLKVEYPTQKLLNQQILNCLVNDHQHWHLGNTLTWTPYNDINLVKILLCCDINELIPQFIDGRLSKNIIAKIDNQLLSALSQYKNYNTQENISKLFEYHTKNLQ
jgi:hypothetical protein